MCGLGNAAGCHGWIHQNPVEAEKLGWIVQPGVDPSTVSALIHTALYGCSWVFLDNDGGIALDIGRRTEE